MDNIQDAIIASIEDAELPEDTLSTEPAQEATQEVQVEPIVKTDTQPQPEVEDKLVDEFDKKFGLTQQAASGRENRIPYSRVKRITEKAVSDAVAAKSKEYEKSHTPVVKYQELEAKVKDYEPKLKDYENRLTQVAQFENIMVNDPTRFITMLAGLPQYSQYLAPLLGQAVATQQTTAANPDGMPQPDQTLTDGSRVYSLDGLKALREWDRKQVERDVMKTVEDRYAPIEKDWQAHQRVQAALPQVQRQIEDARKWPLFNESEAEIVKSLADNPAFSLERAYQSVVWPKMQTDRDKMRTDILKEVKQAPRSTSAPSGSVKAAPAKAGPKSIEDIIRESIAPLK